jgi:hypothetical protein
MRKEAIPMRIKSNVHTGPKTQFGGASSGLASVAYHVGIDALVKRAPVSPMIWGIRSAPARVKMFFVFMIL